MSHKRPTLSDIWRVVKDHRLSDRDVRVWLAYRQHDQKGKGTFVSDDRLSRDIGKSVRTIQAARARLLETGYLKQRLRGPQLARYHAVVPADDSQESAEQDSRESAKQPPEDSQHDSQGDSQNPASAIRNNTVGIRTEYGRERARAGEIPEDWGPTDEHRQLAEREGHDLARAAEMFRSNAKAKALTRADWHEEFRLWLLREKSFAPKRPVGDPDDFTARELEIIRRRQESRRKSAPTDGDEIQVTVHGVREQLTRASGQRKAHVVKVVGRDGYDGGCEP